MKIIKSKFQEMRVFIDNEIATVSQLGVLDECGNVTPPETKEEFEHLVIEFNGEGLFMPISPEGYFNHYIGEEIYIRLTESRFMDFNEYGEKFPRLEKHLIIY